jgi:membrane associated rhomboid family serine protease
MLNVPRAVIATLAALAAVHAVRLLLLSPRGDVQLLLLFSFIPARYDASLLANGGVPGGWPAEIWSFGSYAFIHGDLTHLGLNAVWLLAFGTPVARRFGSFRFALFFIVTAAAGAALHLVTHPGDFLPMVGASAVISGCMAAAIRFMFASERRLSILGGSRSGAYGGPAAPLMTALRDPRVLAFLGVWFALNILFGVGSLSLTDGEQSVAWEAHIGGFLAGLLLFPLFDPVGPKSPARDDDRAGPQREAARR